MKDYMLMYKGGDSKWLENTPPEEIAASMKRWGSWMGELQEKEQLVSGGSPLNMGGKRMTKDGVVTDISSSEFKELVSGYSIIKAATLEDALTITRTCPIFGYPGVTVDIREVTQVPS